MFNANKTTSTITRIIRQLIHVITILVLVLEHNRRDDMVELWF